MEIKNREITINEMLDNPNEYDLPEFLINKINFIKDNKYKRSTSENVLRMFINYIFTTEEILGHDLYKFSKQEIRDLIGSINTSSIRIKKNIESLIANYINYSIERGLIPSNINNAINIEYDEIKEVNEKKLINKYVSMDECYDICAGAISGKNQTGEGLTHQDTIVLLLARYSLSSEEIINLSIEDIDRENMRLIIRSENNDIIRFVSIDNRLLNELDKAIETNEYNRGKATRKYYSNGMVVKPSSGNSIIVSYLVIRNRLSSVVKTSNKPYLVFKDLVKSYQIDFLVDIYNEKGYVENEDFKMALTSCARAANSSYFALKEDFEIMRPDIEIKTIKPGVKPRGNLKE